MRNNRVYITSAEIIAGTQFNTVQKGFRIEAEQYEPLLEHFQTRNVDRISKISLAAAATALIKRDMGIEKGSCNNYGVVFGTQFSAIESIHNYDMEALEKGALSVNPGLFPNTVLNSPACQVSIQCSFAGPVYTVCNGLTSSLDAIGVGYNFVRTGVSPIVLAGGADEITELQAIMKSCDKYLGEAGGFLLLESEKTIAGNEKLAEVIGYKSQVLNKEQKKSLAKAVSNLIIEAAASQGNSTDNITKINMGSVFSSCESETLLSDICNEMNYNGAKKCVETDWMGACGIVQADQVLNDFRTGGSKNAVWAIVNVDKDKASVIILKGI